MTLFLWYRTLDVTEYGITKGYSGGTGSGHFSCNRRSDEIESHPGQLLLECLRLRFRLC